MANQPPQTRPWFRLSSAARPTVPSAIEPSMEPRPFFLRPTFRPMTPNPQTQPTEAPASGPAPIVVPPGPVAQPTFRPFTLTLPSSQTVEPTRQPPPVVASPSPALATEPRRSLARPTFRTLNSALPVKPPEPIPPLPAAAPTPPDTTLPRPPSYPRLSTVAQSTSTSEVTKTTSITAPSSPSPPPIVSSRQTSAPMAVFAPATTQPVPTTSALLEPTQAQPNAASPTPRTPNVWTQQPATPKPFAPSTSLPASPGKKTPPSSTTLQPERFSPSSSSPKPTISPPSPPVKKAPSKPSSTTLPPERFSPSIASPSSVKKAPSLPERFSPSISSQKPTILSPSSSSNGSFTNSTPKIINSIFTVTTSPQSPKPKSITPPPSPLTLPPSEIKFEVEHKSKMPPEVEQKTSHVEKAIDNSPKRNHHNFQNNSAYNNHNPSFKPHNGNPDHPEKVETSENAVLEKISDFGDRKMGMRVITIAGENKGTIMELVHLPKKNDGENIHYLHKKSHHANDNEHEKHSSENGQGKGTSLEDNKSQKLKGNSMQNPLPLILNSNFQGVNNSLLLHSSCTHHDPGVHLTYKSKPSGNGFLSKHHKNGKQT